MSRRWIELIVVILAGIFIISGFRSCRGCDHQELTKEISPWYGPIRSVISTMGTVQPQNRLEIKPPVDGRIEAVLVKEGDQVKQGDILAWMSSKERAALMDMARAQGETALKYWQEAYKSTALIASIDGQVIVRAVEPGQTADASTAILVLSDRLIVKAQVDETDIGKVKVGQTALVSLDAYPQEKIKAVVDHIAYESKTVSNVTIYEVDILPQHVSEVFRSGLSATVDIITASKDQALLIPSEAVVQESNGSYLWVKERKKGKPVKRPVRLGLLDEQNTEVVSGLGPDEKVVMTKQSPVASAKKSGHRDFFHPFFKKK